MGLADSTVRTATNSALLVTACLCTIVMLALLGAQLFIDWRARIVAWRRGPQGLLDARPGRHAAYLVTLVLAGAVASLSLSLALPAVVALTVVGCAAAGVLTSAHLQQSTSGGAFGLALVVLAYVALARVLTPDGETGLVLGLAAGGVQLLWLSRFWAQQLAPEGPWTTAGRLIPAARALSWMVAVVQSGVVGWIVTGQDRPEADPAAVGWLLLMTTAAHSCLLARDAREGRSTGSAIAALLSAPAFALAAHDVLPVAIRSTGLAGALALLVPFVCAAVPAVRVGDQR